MAGPVPPDRPRHNNNLSTGKFMLSLVPDKSTDATENPSRCDGVTLDIASGPIPVDDDTIATDLAAAELARFEAAWPIFGGTDPDYSAQDDQGGDHGDHSPFGRSVNRYRLAGWLGTLPLPAGKKNPPPTGYTGHKASHPTRAQIAAWVGDPARRDANICQRLAGIACAPENGIDAFEVVGIDVDHYVKGGKDKRGGDQLAKLEAELGPLPATWISSARVDGISGIRYFRVPAGLMFRGQVDKDIECIYRGYRFAVVWPSTNPDADGETYWWFPPGTTPDAEGRKAWNPDTDDLPKTTDLPMLPDSWIDHLTQGRMPATADLIDMDSSVDELYAWADATFSESAGDAMCSRITKSIRQQSEQIRRAATSHDKIVKAHFHLYRLAAEGHTGWKAAVEQIEATYRDEVTARDKRGRDELRGELFRSRTNALRKVKAKVDDKVKNGANPVDMHTCPPQRKHDGQATQCLAEVAPQPVRWLWKGWIPLGKVSIFEGESDVGKSTITLDWASIVSTGRPWPETVINDKTLKSQHDPAGVVLVGIEDSNADTVVPRLIAAGADLTRVHALNRPTNDKGEPVPFTIPDDIEWLRKAIVETAAQLVIIDPIAACLPENTKHGVDSSIRRILMSLVDLAEETGCAVVMIRHFNKAAGMNAKNRGGGSVAYSALVRSVLQAGKLEEPGDGGATFAIARAIGNLSKTPKTIGYRLDDAPASVNLPKAEDDELGVAVVKYCGTVDFDADQLVGADGSKSTDARKTAPLRDEVKEALRDMLKDGPQPATEVIDTIKVGLRCSAKPIREAAKELEIVKKSVYEIDPTTNKKRIDHWTWELPQVILTLVHSDSQSAPTADAGGKAGQ